MFSSGSVRSEMTVTQFSVDLNLIISEENCLSESSLISFGVFCVLVAHSMTADSLWSAVTPAGLMRNNRCGVGSGEGAERRLEDGGRRREGGERRQRTLNIPHFVQSCEADLSIIFTIKRLLIIFCFKELFQNQFINKYRHF